VGVELLATLFAVENGEEIVLTESFGLGNFHLCKISYQMGLDFPQSDMA